MKWIKTFENNYFQSRNFNKWFEGSKIINDDGTPKIVYHGTNNKFLRFNKYHLSMGIIWFTDDKNKVLSGDVGVSSKYIKNMYISMKNPAGWEEYSKYGLEELVKNGFDGAILENNDGTYEGFVFEPEQIKIIKTETIK